MILTNKLTIYLLIILNIVIGNNKNKKWIREKLFTNNDSTIKI